MSKMAEVYAAREEIAYALAGLSPAQKSLALTEAVLAAGLGSTELFNMANYIKAEALFLEQGLGYGATG